MLVFFLVLVVEVVLCKGQIDGLNDCLGGDFLEGLGFNMSLCWLEVF